MTHDVAEAVRLADRAIIINPDGVGTMRDVKVDRDDPTMAEQLLRSFDDMSKVPNDISTTITDSRVVPSASVNRRAALGLGFSAAAGLLGSKRAFAQDTNGPLRLRYWATGIQLAWSSSLIQEKNTSLKNMA